MAATLKPNDAYTAVRSEIAKVIAQMDTEAKFRLLDRANKRLWMAAPWSWTVGHLTNIQLQDSTADYTQAPPADFLKLFHVYIGSTDGNVLVERLTIVDSLPATARAQGSPSLVAYMGSNTFRFWKTPSTVGTNQWAVLKYKKIAPVIANETHADTVGILVLDDAWFYVYEEWLAYYMLRWAHSRHAGAAQFDASQRRWVFTGQLANAQAATEEMRMRENLPLEWEYRIAAKADMK